MRGGEKSRGKELGMVNGIIIIMKQNNSNANPFGIVNQYESVQANMEGEWVFNSK